MHFLGQQKKVLLGLLLVMIGIGLLIVSLPVWFPWVLRPLSERFGLAYRAYSRESYSRFALQGLSFTNNQVVLQAGHLELFTPTAWLWHRYLAPAAQPFIVLRDWQLQIAARARKASSQGPSSSVFTNYSKLEGTLANLETWVPKALLTNGVVEFQGQRFQVPTAEWKNAELTAEVALPAHEQLARVQMNLQRGVPHTIQFSSSTLELNGKLSVSSSPEGLSLGGTLFWLTNRVELAARFGRTGWLPTNAHVQAEAFRIPAQRLALKNYQDLKGSLSLTWQTNRYSLDLAATAHPFPQVHLPPLKAEVHARGDTNAAFIETARLRAPWLSAQLSEHAQIQFRPPYLNQPVALSMEADLGRQPWFKAQGHLTGRVRLQPTGANYPAATFTLAGSQVGLPELQAESLQLEGSFAWPWLKLTKTQIVLAGNSTASALAQINLAEKFVQEALLRFEGSWGSQLLPGKISYDHAKVSMSATGPFTNLTHTGNIRVEHLQILRLNPLGVNASWQGAQMNLGGFQVAAVAGDSRLEAAGTAELASSRKTFQLTELNLQTNGLPVLHLAHSTKGWLQPGQVQANHPTNHWRIHLEGFDWEGLGRSLRLAGELVWPFEGEITSAIRNFDSSLFSDFVRRPLPPLIINQLDLSARWDRSPVKFELGMELKIPVTNAPPVSTTAQLQGTRDGVTVKQLVIAGPREPAATAHGFLPVSIQPALEQIITIDPQKPVQLTAATQPDAFVWDLIAKRTGVTFRAPRLELNLAGTLASPHGQIRFQARQISLRPGKRPLPDLEQLALEVKLGREVARLTTFRLLVQNQPVTLTGELPLGESFWTGLANRQFDLDWQKATARLRVPPVELAELTKFIPQPLVPQGEFMADLALEPGGNLAGTLRLGGLRTLPLPGLGPVENIRARLVFSGRTAKLEEASAWIGGQPVETTGVLHLPPNLTLQGELPSFTLEVRGAQVPLVRRPELVLRADLNLSITNFPDKAPLISGVIQLRDSLYLSDLQDLMPGRVASPRRRPPYFSVENELLADWRLNLRVQGQEFLKVRSPLFRGEISTTLRLEGTLKDPIALGEVRIDDGSVRFPFATLEVTQGWVSLTSENPHRPQLFVVAETRRIGYDIRMEVTGLADAPVVQFSSSPPLSPEQILLMVAAGQMPSETAHMSTSQRAQRLVLFLGRNLLSDLGLGGGDEERLTVRSGEEVTAEGSPTYEVEYKLSDDWSLVGEYDRFNDYNVGVKWRIYSK